MDLFVVALLAITCVGAIFILGGSLRHVVALSQTSAKVAEALHRSANAEAIANRASEDAAEAREYAAQRADRVYAQYKDRERQAKKREKDSDADDAATPDATQNGYDQTAREIEAWWQNNAR